MIISELIELLSKLNPEHSVSVGDSETFSIVEMPDSNTIFFDTGIIKYDGSSPFNILRGIIEGDNCVKPV